MSNKRMNDIENEIKGLRELLVRRDPVILDRIMFLLDMTQEMYMSISESNDRIRNMSMQMNAFNQFLKDKELQDTYKSWVDEQKKKAKEQADADAEKKLAEQKKKIEELEKDGN